MATYTVKKINHMGEKFEGKAGLFAPSGYGIFNQNNEVVKNPDWEGHLVFSKKSVANEVCQAMNEQN